MRIEEAHSLWKSQDQNLETTMADNEILEIVKKRSTKFDEEIHKRDRRELIAVIPVVILFLFVFTSVPAMSKVGVVVILLSTAFVLWTLRGARRTRDEQSFQLPVTAVVREELTRVDRQIRLLTGVFWWYIAPLATGALLFVWGVTGPSWFMLGYAAFVVVVAMIIVRLNRTAVDRDLRPKRDELLDLLGQAESA
ncbi:MAG TPA: hypothetical protein VFI91_09025 [Longimicrobiaceae bacterium]|nr:hypothetical protein [Longimicrobiaceae bacterium]